MSTTSNVNSIGGVQTVEQYENDKLFGLGREQALGKNTFLRLLTTQLQHQDPLNPMDNTQFVTQLSQFSSLEQLTTANENLVSLAAGMSSVGNATMVNLIGKEVKAVGDGFHHEKDTPKTLHFSLDGAAESASISVFDKEGNLVVQKTMNNLEAGDQSFVWDGKNSSGVSLASGDYTFKVTATAGSSSVGVTTYTQGLVDQIDFTSGVAAPRVDGQTLTVDKIIQILEPVEETTTD